ncbi:tRNA (guanine-N(1)-)-methyltransferase [anaerobic digester metagenome]
MSTNCGRQGMIGQEALLLQKKAMRIDILTIFPEMFTGPFSESIIKRAINKKLADIYLHNIRDYAAGKHKNVDDYAYGGRAGMVMMIQPIADCIEKLKSERNYDEIIFLTPDGYLFEQSTANQLSLCENLILLCGHYKGIDERIREQYITREISIGDYVLSGGELAAAVVTDAIIRLLPGVLGDETSALSDSFQDKLLSPPVYTRPSNYKGWEVPEILLSGNDKEISLWNYNQALKRTEERRPHLLDE